MKRLLGSALLFVTLPSIAAAVPVIVPDNGSGTAQMPILADYPSLTPMMIVDGLPMGSQVNIAATHETPTNYAEQAGGTLGGTRSAGGGPLFTWQMTGTGVFAAFNRTIVMPGGGSVASFFDPAFTVSGSNYEVHAAPRMLAAPVQTYATDMFRMFSQIIGDPDFDLLRFTAGTDFGMPSPGQTKLTQVGPNWNVESFFDVTYRIDFVGRAGGTFSGMSGSTTRTVRLQIGEPVPEPASLGLAAIGLVAAAWARRLR
jgi:hypothetical protein